jgi:uncharacterized protein
VRLAIRLTPRARREQIEGTAAGMLKVSVMAPPVDNEANEALLRLLAKHFRLPRQSLSITGGAKSRGKIIRVAGDPAMLTQRLTAAIAALPNADSG